MLTYSQDPTPYGSLVVFRQRDSHVAFREQRAGRGSVVYSVGITFRRDARIVQSPYQGDMKYCLFPQQDLTIITRSSFGACEDLLESSLRRAVFSKDIYCTAERSMKGVVVEAVETALYLQRGREWLIAHLPSVHELLFVSYPHLREIGKLLVSSLGDEELLSKVHTQCYEWWTEEFVS